MPTITKIHSATPFGTDKINMQLLRVIGTTDIDGKGINHPITDVDPFIFLDDAQVEGELPITFSKHPHTGLTAVSYLLDGTAHAWDNIHGSTPALNHAGGVYCIHAGKGVVHGEAPIEGVRKLRLLQLWFNPGLDELPMPAANYQLFQPNELPVYADEKLWCKIIIGTAFDKTSPVQAAWPIQYLHIKLLPKASYELPIMDNSWNGFIYVIRSNGLFGNTKTKSQAKDCLILAPSLIDSLPISNANSEPLEFIWAFGKPHHKPFFKLLGHGGAIVANTETNARLWMKQYESDPDNFGK